MHSVQTQNGDKKCSQNEHLSLWNKLSELTDGLGRKCSVIKACNKHVVQPAVTDWSIQRASISYPGQIIDVPSQSVVEK